MRTKPISGGRIPTNHLLLMLFFFFKTIPALIAGGSIYLGYRLFILGVTGKASLSIDTGTVSGQLINAAPGLFFAIGGLVALVVIVWKDVDIRMPVSNLTDHAVVKGVEVKGVEEVAHVVGVEIDKIGK